MTDKMLIKRIHTLYKNTKTAKCRNSRIFRGTSPTVSAKAEDLFACWLDAAIPDKSLRILVDTSIMSDKAVTKAGTGKTKKKQFKPDICVINSTGEVKLLCELKMDMGFMRDFTVYAEERRKVLGHFLNAAAHYREDKKQKCIRFPRSLRWHYIVFSEDNISCAKRAEIKREFKKRPVLGRLFMLSRGEHLSISGAKYTVNDIDFTLLKESVQVL